ncbi:MAG: translation initiation factor IF-2 [Candidatus Firestonebacteria bacterium]
MKSKKRVYEIAKEIGISSGELLEELKKLKITVNSHMSMLDDATVKIVLDKFKKVKEVKEVKKVEKEIKEVKEVKKVEKEEKVKEEKKVKEEEKASEAGPELRQTIETKPVIKEVVVEKIKPIIKITEVTTVGELSGRLNVAVTDLIKKIISMGMMVTINQKLDKNTISLIADEYGYNVEFISIFSDEILEEIDEDKSLKRVPRPPVVTVMGHVDHGKTSLLDVIRNTRVTEKEAGGITQHIGAYKVQLPRGEIIFLDTPGHEAFTAMRARGVKVTDIVVLVVAADEGVMPQTIEAIDHAKAAKVPIIVAVNKMDKPAANIEKVKQELSGYALIAEAWGGKTIFVPVSAKKNTGIDELLEVILLEAEMLELKTVREGLSRGVVLEARLDKGRGPVATVLIERGILRIGDAFISGFTFGKVRAMINDKGERLTEAIPPIPVEITGFSGVSNAGDTFCAISDEKSARQISLRRNELRREINIQKAKHISLESLYNEIKEGKLRELRIVLKGDVQGSIDAVSNALEKLSTDKIRVFIIHKGVGDINESDVMLASASNAIVIGFNVNILSNVSDVIKREEVDVKLFKIIYEITDAVKNAMEGILEPVLKEVVIGKVEVKQLIKIPNGVIAGSYVLEGKITRGTGVKILRDGEIIGHGKVSSLKRFKEDVKEVLSGYECGLGIDGFKDFKIGDLVEVVIIEKTLSKL